MSPSRGHNAAVGGVGGGGEEEASPSDDPLGPSASSAAAATSTEEGAMASTPTAAESRGRRGAWWRVRWRVGVVLLAVVAAVVLAVGLSLRGGGRGGGGGGGGATAGPGPGSGPGDAGSEWQSQQQLADDGVPSGLVGGKQQPPQPPAAPPTSTTTPAAGSAPANANGKQAAATGQGQAAAAASALTDMAKQVLGEGGGNRDPGGGLFEDEEEDEAEGSFIAVEGCTPANGGELHFIVERSTCPVVTLLPGVFYNLTEYIVVRRPVLIVGRPLNPPTIDAHLAYRAFLVEAGGALDLRHVVIYRGKPILVIEPDIFFEVRGAAAYIRNGGAAFFTDCVMLLHEDTVSEFLVTPNPQSTVRMSGGFLLLEAGTLHVVGCHILVQRPGVLFREVYVVGGFILVVSGTLFLTGSTLTASFLFITVLGAGNFVTVLGGNAVITGVVFTLNGGFVAGNGIGLLQFIGGGTATFTGSVSQGNLLFLSFFGAGMGQFTGGGVSILTGMVFSSVSVMNYGAGVGFNNGLGGGVMVKTGVTQSGAHSQSALAVLGVATFVGAGTVVYSETAWNRNTALAAFYGGGGSLYLGTGVATIVNSVSMGVTATVIAAAAGGDHVVFAGWLTMVNSWFFKWVVIAAYYGQGVDTALIAGGALIARSGWTGYPPIVDANRGLYSIYVAGHGIALNQSRDVVLATHKTFWVRDHDGPGKRQRRLGSGSGDGGGALKKLGLTGGFLPLPGGPGRLELRRVRWREPSPEQLKGAVRESAGEGLPAQWPWRLQAAMDAEEAEERRRRAQEEEAVAAPVAVAAALEQQQQQQVLPGAVEVEVGEAEAPFVALYPGSPVLVPRAEPRPAEGPKAQSRVYVASPLARCRACGVRGAPSGGGAGAVVTTADAFAGVGAEACEFSEACAAPATATGEEDGEDGEDYSDVMWMAGPPGSPRQMPNTSLAIVDLEVASPTVTGPDAQRLLRAVNRTIASLGLGPPRYHLRVVPAAVPLPYDPAAEGGRLRRLLQEQQETQAAAQQEAAAPSEEGPCPLRVPFKAYLVSDRAEVVAALAKGLRQPAAAAAMAAALQQEQEGEVGTAAACGVRATRAVQTHIPGLNSSALLQPPAVAATKGAAAGTGIARLLAAAGKMRPTRTVLFGGGADAAEDDGTGDGGGTDSGRALAAAPPAATGPVHPTAALLVHGGHGHADDEEDEVDEEEDGSRVAEIRAGGTYTLALARFPPGRRLRVRLVSAAGRGALLQVLPSAPRGERARQGWAWRVDAGLPPGKYFLEVVSHARDAFAYSQAFEVVPGPERAGQ